MEDLVGAASSLANVRLSAVIGKLAGGMCGGWNKRFVVLAGNFLYVYGTAEDPKPRRVICVDDATAVATDRFPQAPHAFELTTRKGRVFNFAPPSADDKAAWLAAIIAAGYTLLYTRSREAAKFTDRLKDLTAPWAVAVERAAAAGNEGMRQAALDADMEALKPEDSTAQRAALMPVDIITAVSQLLEAQKDARTVMADQQAESDALRTQLVDVAARAAQTTPAGGATARGAAVVDTGAVALRARVDELTTAHSEAQTRASDLAHRVEALNRELQQATSAAAKAARAAATVAPTPGEQSVAAEAASLRARLIESEAALQRARAEAEARRTAQLGLSERRPVASTAAVGSSAASTAAAPPRPPLSPTRSGTTVSSGAGVAASIAGGVGLMSTQPRSGAASDDPLSGGGGGGGGADAEWAPFLAEAQRMEREGNYPDAQLQYEVVLDRKQELCGSESVPVASVHRDLGRVLALQRRFDAAESHYSTAVSLCARLLGEKHPNTACALTDLAAVLREQNNFEGAELYARRAVASLQAGVGPDDVSTATALYNLAGLAKRQGKWDAAGAAYAEALRIFSAKLGDGQGETADTLYQMGCLYRKRNEVSAARSYFTRAGEAYAKCYGADDKRVAEATKRAKAMAEKLGGAGVSATSARVLTVGAKALN